MSGYYPGLGQQLEQARKNPERLQAKASDQRRGYQSWITRLEAKYREEIELLDIGLGDIQIAAGIKNNIYHYRKKIEEIE